MLNRTVDLRRADLVANRYLCDCEALSKNEIITELERTGYELARNGKTAEATSVFIAVADLTEVSLPI